MYERSAILLEKYYNEKIGNENKTKLKTNYKNFKLLVEEIQKYLEITEEEEKIINEFDQVAKRIMKIQQEVKKLNKENINLEEQRVETFGNFDEEPALLNEKLIKIEQNIEKNNKRLQELRNEFIDNLTDFTEKQKERNKQSKIRRAEESNYIKLVKSVTENISEIETNKIKEIKAFINAEDDITQPIIQIMIDNGKDERIGFNKDVIENSVKEREMIAKKEAECYIVAYERVKKLLLEINNEDVKLEKYKKSLNDISVKLSFLKAQTNYIISFLDNERITAINGQKVHDKLMEEACENFKLDINQFDNLYKLILREIAGKATKKAYKELYNKEYLKKIQEKEKKFEQETNSIKIRTGTIINSNYWRIQEIQNIYQVFLEEVSNKFEKDLSEFQLEDVEEIEEIEEIQEIENVGKVEEIEDLLGLGTFNIKKNVLNKKEDNDEEDEYIDEDYLDDEDEEDEYEDNDYLEYDDEEENEYGDDDYLDDEDEDEEYADDDYLDDDDDEEDEEYADDDYLDNDEEDEEYIDDDYLDDDEEDDEYIDDDYLDDDEEDDENIDDDYLDDDDEEDEEYNIPEEKSIKNNKKYKSFIEENNREIKNKKTKNNISQTKKRNIPKRKENKSILEKIFGEKDKDIYKIF